jgi:hypothetical protein
VNYVVAGYVVGLGTLALYVLSLIGRRRRLARAVARVERTALAERDQ